MRLSCYSDSKDFKFEVCKLGCFLLCVFEVTCLCWHGTPFWSCFSGRHGTKTSPQTRAWCRPNRPRAVPGPCPCRAGPGRPDGQLYLSDVQAGVRCNSSAWTSVLAFAFRNRGARLIAVRLVHQGCPFI
jgi:hypothetical protein